VRVEPRCTDLEDEGSAGLGKDKAPIHGTSNGFGHVDNEDETMKSIQKVFPFILAITVIGVVHAQMPHRSFSLGISATHETVKVGSPVIVKVQLKNISDHDINRMGLGGGDVHGEVIGFPPIVRDAQGKEPPLTKWGRLVFGRELPEDHSPGLVLNAVGPVAMHPGEIMRTEIRINELYDLSVPEKYTIQVRHYDEENKEEVKSATITVTVMP
jgi:hypothetical protein